MKEHIGEEPPHLQASLRVIYEGRGPGHRRVWAHVAHGHSIVHKHTHLDIHQAIVSGKYKEWCDYNFIINISEVLG